MAVRALTRRRTSAVRLLRALDPPFLAFVLALGVVVRAVLDRGLGDALDAVLPDGTGLVSLLAVAALAAIGDESEAELVRRYLADANPRLAATAAVVLARSSRESDRQAAEATLVRLTGDATGRSTSWAMRSPRCTW